MNVRGPKPLDTKDGFSSKTGCTLSLLLTWIFALKFLYYVNVKFI